MRRMVRVGDTLTLPSGTSCTSPPLRILGDHGELIKSALCGAYDASGQPEQVHREAWEHYTGDKSVPLLLVLHDAVALAFALNRVGPTDCQPRPPESDRARVGRHSGARRMRLQLSVLESDGSPVCCCSAEPGSVSEDHRLDVSSISRSTHEPLRRP
jgi:hypothetical protein